VLDIPPPTDVITLVLLAWTAGTAVFGALTRIWGEVEAGHFKVVWLTVAGLGLATGIGYRPALIVAGLALVAFAAIYRMLDGVAGTATGMAALAALGFGGPAYGFAVALLLGAVTNAMLLGHWHLNQPRLGTRPIARLVWALWVALVAFIAASVALLVVGGADGVRSLGGVTAIAFAAFCGILTAMVHHLVRTRSIMSATGILYLEILMLLVSAFTGSLAALA
jgi:hypothetical protein